MFVSIYTLFINEYLCLIKKIHIKLIIDIQYLINILINGNI